MKSKKTSKKTNRPAQTVAPSEHARFAPSSAERWMTCTASIPYIESLGLDNTDNEHSALGTFAHVVAAQWLTDKRKPGVSHPAVKAAYREYSDLMHSLKKEAPALKQLYPSVAADVQEYVQFANAEYKRVRGMKMCIEARVQYYDDMFGTADCIIYGRDTLSIIDLKYGKGVLVGAENNAQLLLYAALAPDAQRFRRFRASIVQPRRADSAGDYARTFEFDGDRLSDFVEEVNRARDAVLTGKIKFVPTEKGCKWCPAGGSCAARAAGARKIAMADFDTPETFAPPVIGSLSTDQIKFIMDNSGAVKSFLKAVEQEAFQRHVKGDRLQGYKLVDEYGNRSWIDTKAVEKQFAGLPESDLYEPRALRSPAQLEKIVGKAQVAPLTHRAVKGVALVPESDKRPATAVSDFSDVRESDELIPY